MALLIPFAGQAHFEHMAIHNDARVGGSFKGAQVETLDLADFSPEGQSAFMRFAAEAAEKWGVGDLEDNETEFAEIVADAEVRKEAKAAKEAEVEK